MCKPRTLSASRWIGASSFEETVNPFGIIPLASQLHCLYSTSGAQRFVIKNLLLGYSYSQHTTVFAGKIPLDDWSMSGIIQFQSGFPIRIQTEDDNELISSLFFLRRGCSATVRQTANSSRIPKQTAVFIRPESRESVLRPGYTPGTFRHNAPLHLLRTGRKPMGRNFFQAESH